MQQNLKSTKDKILDCTIEMLKAGNVDTISMSKIALNANIGKSTIYEHFSSKEDIAEVFQKGYRLGNKVLRYSKVKVTKKRSETQEGE